jgi:tetratricopeptide (TPR) repeat protein
MVLEENHDCKKAHEMVNRYMRDIDLFQTWLKHPKVAEHIKRKFGVDISTKYDRLMALTMSMYTRAKIQVYEDDPGGALKSLTTCMAFFQEGGKLDHPRHRKLMGAVLVARGMVYCKLKSFERAEDDLTRALSFVNPNRSPTLFQLRAEAREALGRLEEARMDEEMAAQIWEKGDVVRYGPDGQPLKFVN